MSQPIPELSFHYAESRYDCLDLVNVHATAFANAHHNDNVPGLPPEERITRQEVEDFVFNTDFIERKLARWQTVIDAQGPEHRTILARYQGLAVGLGEIAMHSEGVYRIYGLYVLPAIQRRYTGSALLFLLNHLARDVPAVDAFVINNDGFGAIDFYKKRGFLEVKPSQAVEETRASVLKPQIQKLRSTHLVRLNTRPPLPANPAL